jgi:lipopolysaccharide export system protein LptC
MKPRMMSGLTQEMETILGSIARYTRFVKSIKVALAVLAAILSAVILFYPVLKRDTGVRIAFTSIEKKGPTAQTQMMNAHFRGLDKDNQPFNVLSKTATQINDNTMGLDKVSGDITLKGGAWLSVSANTGTFLVKEKTLDLKGAIEMFNDEGYEFRSETMHVNVGDKSAITHDVVDGQGPLGILKAYGGAAVGSAGGVITFEGPVFVTVFPSRGDDSKKNDTGVEPKKTEQ